MTPFERTLSSSSSGIARAAALVWGGVTVGALVGWAARALLERESRRAAERHPVEGRRWTEALGEAAEEIARARTRLFAPETRLDFEALADEVERVAGEAPVGVHALGEGIVEVVGTCDEALARRVLASVAAFAGVDVVVNRVWTPSSAHTAGPDASRDSAGPN